MKAELVRNTKETEIALSLEYPGTDRNLDISCGFMSHMIDLMCSRAGLGISLKAIGIYKCRYHHLAEDIGIVLDRYCASLLKASLLTGTAGACFRWMVPLYV